MDLFIWSLFGLFSIVSSSSITRRAAPDVSPQYVAVSPSELRPDVPFRVFISNLQTQPLQFSADVVIDTDPGSDSNVTVLSSASSVVEGGGKKILLIPTPDSSSLNSGSDLWLWVRGTDPSSGVMMFSNETQLQFQPRTQTTLIQTDRSRYKPGERVHIRVLSLRRDLTALDSSKDVHVKDPRGRLLRLWASVDSVLGVSTVEFNLSKSPPLGEWTISATVQGVSTEKHFLVEHYVLPKFKVEISVPTIIFSKHLLHGNVMAKYFHGGHVSGTVSITFVHHSHGRRATYHWGTRLIEVIQYFEFMIPHMDFTRERMIHIDEYDEEYLEILAQVTDSGTGLQYNSSVKVEVAKDLYKLSFEGHRRVFQPGTVFDTQLKVQMYDGHRPYPRDLPKVQISVLQQKNPHLPWHQMGIRMNHIIEWPSEETSGETSGETSEETSEDLELDVPENGIISLSIPIKEETHLLTIDASFHESIASLFVERSHTSESGSYLQIHGPHAPVQPGDVTLRIWSSFPLDEYHYLVKSRGELVLSGSSSAEDLLLNLDSAWSPMVSVLVFVVLPQGELVMDRIQLHVQADLRNHVSLNWASRVMKPHEEVALTVSVMEPHSLVGILVVDMASRDSAHNDITKRQVMKATGKLDSLHEDDFSGFEPMGDPYTLFTESGLQVMTDASYHQTYHKDPVWALDGVQMRPTKAEPPPVHSRIRTHFPETWLWMDLLTGDNTIAEVSALTPDSMTTWVASAFVMSPTLGIGFMDAPPAELTVRQSFFLSLNLPPLVVRGEELLLEIFLYNYLPSNVKIDFFANGAEVKVEKTFDLEFLSGSVGDEMRTVEVGHMQVAAVRVPVRVLSVGDVLLSVRARAPEASDHIKRTIHVKAEGRPQSFTESRLLVLPKETEAEEQISYTFPPNVVPDSCEVWVSSVGDVLGAAMTDLDSLILRPYGCGEQNMIRFAPMVYVLEYLRSVGETDSATTRRALELMREGYERQLSFQREDGSVSAFGDNDRSGSTWLTAFVLRVFLQARPFLAVSPDVLRELVEWLFEQTSPDGHFLEPGRVIHSELVGGRDSERSLTAYVVIALLEDPLIWSHVSVRESEVLERRSKVSSALLFLEEGLAEGIKSLYSLSLVTYALSLAKSSNANTAVDLLLQSAYHADGALVWTANAIGHAPSRPRSTDIEALGYLLLALQRLTRSVEGLQLLQWLIKQQNGHGGFGSTQDTVVALHALSVYAAMGSQDPSLRVTQTHGNWSRSEFSIDRDTSRILHRTLRSSCSSSSAAVRAVGRGLLLFQVSVAYNVFPEDHLRRRRSSEPQEELYLNLKTMEFHENLVLSACFRLSDWSNVSSTGMAVLEVQLLTGFSFRPVSSFNMELVKKVETNENNGRLVLYLDSVTQRLQCVTILLKQEFKAGHVQDALVELYDYYEPGRKAEGLYSSQLKNQSSCSFCGSSCADCAPHDDYGPYNATTTSTATTNAATTNAAMTASTTATTTAATTTAMTTLQYLDLNDYYDDHYDDYDHHHNHSHYHHHHHNHYHYHDHDYYHDSSSSYYNHDYYHDSSSTYYNHDYYYDYSYHYNHHEYHNTYHQSNHHYDYDYYHHYNHHYYHDYYHHYNHHNGSGSGDGSSVAVMVVISRGVVLLPLPPLLFLLPLLI